MKNFINGFLFLLFFILIAFPSNAEIISHQAPGIPESKDFKVWVNESEVFTGQAGNGQHGFYSFSNFDFTGKVTIKVWSLRAIKWLDILPSILRVEHTIIDDYTFEFSLNEPKKITIMLNNDRRNALHILTSLPEIKKPAPDEKNVLYFKSGNTYDIGVLDLKDNQTLYIEGGARLKGMVRVKDVENVKILGRGMIDGSDNNSSQNGPNSDAPRRLIYLDHAKNVTIEGITLFNSLSWTIQPYSCKNVTIDNIRILNWNYGSDGIDISASQDVTVKNSFLRTNDDCIVIKALSLNRNNLYPKLLVPNMDVVRILVEGCVVWNMAYGNPFEIGFELICNKVSDIIFRDCDVIMQYDRGAVFSIHNSDNAIVENILYDNIRVENANLHTNHKMFDLAILFSSWSYDRFADRELIRKYRFNDSWDNLLPILPGTEEFHASHRGQIRNIRFRNIQILDGCLPYSVINGYDKDHIVENVTFENITVKGEKIINEKELKLFSKYAEDIKIK